MFQTGRSVGAHLHCPDGSSEVSHHQAEREEGAGGGVWTGRAGGDCGGPDRVQADHHRDGHQVKTLNRGEGLKWVKREVGVICRKGKIITKKEGRNLNNKGISLIGGNSHKSVGHYIYQEGVGYQQKVGSLTK